MADPRFFPAAPPIALARLAEIAGARLPSGADGERRFRGVASLSEAEADDVSFLDNRRYVDSFVASRAGACLVQSRFAVRAPATMCALITDEPYRAYALIAAAFHPEAALAVGVDRSATVDPSAQVAVDASIEAGAVIGAHVVVGARSWVGPNSVIGPGVVIGADCRIGPNVTIVCAILGDRVRIYAGARIGQDGFGYVVGRRGHLKVPQLGRVLIGDGAEIGANTTIDRGSASDTVIGPGTVIDNLVQIAHNVRTGANCVIVAQTGISGSTRLGDLVMLGGQAGLTGHLEIGDGAQVAAQAGVHRNVSAGEIVMGSPAMPAVEYRSVMRAMLRLARGPSTAQRGDEEGE